MRVLRFLGHGAADQLGPVCAAADRERVAAALPGVLSDRHARADVLVGDRLSAIEGWSGLTGARVLLAEPSPTLAIDGQGWDEFLAGKSKNFRDQVRRRERKLAKSHDLAFRLSDSSRLEEDLGTLTRLHAARWQDESAAFEPDLEAFHREFAAVALDRGWLRLWICEVDGSPVAASVRTALRGLPSASTSRGATPNGTPSRWASSCSPTASAARFEDGMTEYRFLRGGDAYKDRFADGDSGLETAVLGRGPLGRPAVAAAGALGRLPRGDRLLARAGRG